MSERQPRPSADGGVPLPLVAWLLFCGVIGVVLLTLAVAIVAAPR